MLNTVEEQISLKKKTWNAKYAMKISANPIDLMNVFLIKQT